MERIVIRANKANLVDGITIAELEQSRRNDNKHRDGKDSEESGRVENRRRGRGCERRSEVDE